MTANQRIISSILALLFCVLSLVSCAGKNVTPDDTVPEYEPETEIPDEKNYDSSTTEFVKTKYAGYDYNGYEFNILSVTGGNMFTYNIGDNANELWYPEDSADVQQHSVFTRNTLTEEHLKCKISPTWGGDVYEMYDRARTIALSGTEDFDLFVTHHTRGMLSGTMGYFHNMYDIKSLDMEAYWWDQRFIDCYTYEFNKLFSLTGDCFIYDDLAFDVVFFNSNMIENYGLDDPTVLVEEGKWTVERMMEMAHAVTADSNGDGLMTSDDTWGILDNNGVIVMRTFDGFGVHVADKDENDIPYLATENDVFVNAVQYIYDNIVMSGTTYEAVEDDNYDIFRDDRGLFMNESLGTLFVLREMESDFGLLPLAKLSENQKDYSSTMQIGITTTISIPVTVKDTEKVGIFLDVFGGYSTDTVDRTLNETILGAKLVRNKRTVEMLEYALESKFYDWARDLKWAFPIYQCMTDQGHSKVFNFASSIKRYTKMSKAMLVQLLNGYAFY